VPAALPGPFGGLLASGTGARFGGTASLEAFTETRWVTIRGDVAAYPFSTIATRPEPDRRHGPRRPTARFSASVGIGRLW